MRKFYTNHKTILTVLFIIFLWRIYLFIIQSVAFLYPARIGYLGFVPEGNFDGIFYVNISQYWYRGLDQAFFPLYPIFLKVVTLSSSVQPAVSGIIVSTFSLIMLLYTFKKLMVLDGLKKYGTWVILFLLLFPTSFFLQAVYTESLFLLLVLLSFYFGRKGQLKLATFFAIFATATRIVGIFLLPALLLEVYIQMKDQKKKVTIYKLLRKSWIVLLTPLGLLSYMIFLWYKYADPLLFVHIQPAFGAGRSGGDLILLPQVLYRYTKILLSVSYSSQTFFVSIFELTTFLVVSLLLFLGYKKGVRKSYILFSIFVLYFPTLSGTLSSIPRYAIMSFAIFIFLSTLQNKTIKVSILIIGLILQSILAMLFLRGYFIA